MTREEILEVAKPILFNTDMVRAILENRKSVTRRCIKWDFKQVYGMACFKGKWYETYGNEIPDDLLEWYIREFCKPKYKPGDHLYVRETWANLNTLSHPCYYYRASDTLPYWALGSWLPSIHMPKEAAKIFLKVTDVRVERLQDITSEQICREGIEVEYPYELNGEEKRYAFSQLWLSTIRKEDLDKYGWDVNPWVWVYEFERVEV